MYIYIYIYTHVYVYTCIDVCTYAYNCVYMSQLGFGNLSLHRPRLPQRPPNSFKDVPSSRSESTIRILSNLIKYQVHIESYQTKYQVHIESYQIPGPYRNTRSKSYHVPGPYRILSNGLVADHVR